MTREEVAKVNTGLRSKRARSLIIAWACLVLTIALGLWAFSMPELRYWLGYGILILVTLNQTIVSFSTASQAKKELQCGSCNSLDTIILDITRTYYDTTEVRTHRTTHHSNGGDEVGYSETSYEVPTVSSYQSLEIHCNSCGKNSSNLTKGPSSNLIDRINGGVGNPIGLVANIVIAMIVVVVGFNVMTGSIPLAAILTALARGLTHDPRTSMTSAQHRPAEEPLTTNSRVSLHGIGSVKIGMSFEDAMVASGQQLVKDDDQNKSCYIATAKDLSGISFMIHDGRVACAYIIGKGLATLRGARIGQDMQEVLSLYGGRLREEPHNEGEQSHSFTYISDDASERNLRLKFMSDGRTLGGIVVGKLPEMEWEEGCN